LLELRNFARLAARSPFAEGASSKLARAKTGRFFSTHEVRLFASPSCRVEGERRQVTFTLTFTLTFNFTLTLTLTFTLVAP
jgi:DsbC/DsbD-like thiol-disulfide interchange protein